MQLNRTAERGLASLWIGVVSLAILAGPALAQGEEQERETHYLFHYFADSDHVHVFSHYGQGEVRMREADRLFVQWNHERVVIPGISAPAGSPEAVNAITTASRPIASGRKQYDPYADYTKVRNEARADYQLPHGRFGYYVSREEDYFAQLVRGSWDRDFLERNVNLALGTSYGWDRIDPVADDDTPGGAGEKTTLHGNAVLTGTLGPKAQARLGFEWNRVRGLQHNPYRNVYAAGTRVPERHPSERGRYDLFLRLNRYFENQSAVKLQYIYYSDDWGVRAQTLGAQLAQRVASSATVEYRYRYYRQDRARFYRAEYALLDGIDGYRTGDYRLGDFSAHLFGGHADLKVGAWLPGVRWLAPLALGLSYERYFNTNNFSANVLETGLEFGF